MKLSVLLSFVVCMHASANSYSQTVSFSGKNVPLSTVFSSIEKQTGLSFFFNYAVIKDTKPVTLNVRDVPFEEALKQVLSDQGLDFYRTGKTIFIVREQATTAHESLVASTDPLVVNVKGKVTNQSGEALSSATVAVKNGKKMTLTNERGEFELKNVQKGTVLEISYLGYLKKEVQVGQETQVLVQLSLANNQLDELHVIAYGHTSQRFSTGNISMVKGEDIEKQPVNNPLLALEGRVPGLFITQGSGLSGTAVTVRLQGQNSIDNGNNPLYVIDGVPYLSELLSTTSIGPFGFSTANTGTGNPMDFIDPASIESVEVLKDADATSIYGSRAANGAILITTKTGKAGKSKVTLNFQNGWGSIVHKMPLMNTQQYLEMRHEALRNDGISAPSPTDYDINGTWDTTRFTDWQKTLIGRTSHYLQANASVSGGTVNSRYMIGGTYSRQTAVFPGNFNDAKGAMHFNLNTISTNQKLKIQLTGNYLMDNNNLPSMDLTNTSLTLAPDAPPVYKSDGTLNWQLTPSGIATWTNPLSYLNMPYQRKSYNLIGSSALSYTLFPGLEILANLGYNDLQVKEFSGTFLSRYDPATQLAIGTSGRGSIYSNSTINSWIVEPQLNYKKIIAKGRLDFLLGSTIQKNHSEGLQTAGIGYSSDALLHDIRSASTVYVGTSVFSDYRYNALFGRLNYIWNDRYILDLSARRDGSSRFGPANQFHDFTAVGLGWIFSEERIVKKHLKGISYGKIRFSYGTTGSDQIADYAYLSLYTPVGVTVPYQSTVGLNPTNLPNPYLQWEETRKLQTGIDLGFLQNRIIITGNYVYNRSSNELINVPQPIITGFFSISENVPATIQNTAIELSLATINIKNKSFEWKSNFNLTVPKNKLVSYYGTVPPYIVLGEPVGSQKFFHFTGVDPQTGLYQFLDSHGNSTSNPDYSEDPRSVINSIFPKFYGGLQNSLRYKSFQMDFLLQFVNKIASNYIFGAFLPGLRYTNEPAYVLNRWQQAGDIKPIQKYNTDFSALDPFFAAQSSDAFYSDASFVRLKTLSISYHASEKLLRNLHMQGLSIYLQGQNIFTISKFKGLDPETGNAGLPPLRILSVGGQFEF